MAVASESFCHADITVVASERREKRKQALLGSNLPRNISVAVNKEDNTTNGECVNPQLLFNNDIVPFKRHRDALQTQHAAVAHVHPRWPQKNTAPECAGAVPLNF